MIASSVGCSAVNTQDPRTIVLSLLVAATGPALAGIGWELIFDHGYHRYQLSALLVLGALAYPFAFLFVSLIGLPAFLLARRLNLVRWWSAICVGLLGGTLIEIAMSPQALHVENIFLRAVQGAASAILFYLCVGSGNVPNVPDRRGTYAE